MSVLKEDSSSWTLHHPSRGGSDATNGRGPPWCCSFEVSAAPAEVYLDSLSVRQRAGISALRAESKYEVSVQDWTSCYHNLVSLEVLQYQVLPICRLFARACTRCLGKVLPLFADSPCNFEEDKARLAQHQPITGLKVRLVDQLVC